MEIQSILKEYWGYDSFRPLQKDIIESVLQGKDTLAVLPTGGGKSICFQIPALIRPGICLVVSPLIALMKDQVENLKKRSIPALMIHSGMKRQDVKRILKNATDDYFKFLYVSPERLETTLFKEYLPALNINLIAVDEAHCISQWGYDFRPSYLRIADLRKELTNVPVLALTASATPEVQIDICDKLFIPSKNIFKQSFERKNLSYSVLNPDSKFAKLADIINKIGGTSIVYCKSRKRTQDVCDILKANTISANNYHAGLNSEERVKRQQDWIDNKIQVIVCTNAFGMGIDKPDVRSVIHVDVPDCLENYYQEAGRAGRAGLKAYTILLYDERELNELAESHLIRYPSIEKIKEIYQALVQYLQIPVHSGLNCSYTFKFEEFVKNFKLKGIEALYGLKALEQDGWMEFNEKNFSPSTVIFTTSKQALYEFYKSHAELEQILTSLLRSYEGIFDFPAFISEAYLARLLKKDVEVIKNQLKMASSLGMIDYEVPTEDPQIIFRKNRVESKDLLFNYAKYEARKASYVKRVRNMITYVQSNECRSLFIGKYFGDHESKACGICDNCIKSKSDKLAVNEFELISTRITRLLSDKPVTIKELIQAFDPAKIEKAWEVIEFMQSENKISVNESGLLELT
ncbi:MAG: ATP-dependent DNA helicase RecQ [Flavisolibacter sp.]